MIIAVDAAGGDYAPHEIVKGAIKAVSEFNIDIALVGRRNVLHVLMGKQLQKAGISIIDAPQTIDFDEHPVRAIRSKPKSSIVVGVNLVRDGKADAFVSAGNTGAVLGAAIFNLGVVKGVDRPAIGCFLDTRPSIPALLVDAGANADCRPHHLVQFAQLGATYSRYLLNLETPRVALLNNGGEEGKGNRLMQETFPLLKRMEGVKFIGNIEGMDILRKSADVIVTDGFTGNVVIKTIEGLNDNFLKSVRQIGHIFSHASQLRGRDLLRDVGLGSWVKSMDYTEYGGACLLGVEGNVIIAHGRSQAKAIKNAISLAKETVEQKIIDRIREGSYEQAGSN